MGEVRLNDQPDAFEPEELEAEVELVPASAASTALVKPGEARFVGHLKKPYLQIAHGVGGLSQAGFQPGEIVLNKKVVVYSPAKLVKGTTVPASAPVTVTVISAVDYWKEVTKYGDPKLPRTWPTEADALAAGMTTQYPPFGSGLPLPTARAALNIDLLVREPEGVEDRGEFLFKLDGAYWAPARFICDKAMYTESIDPMTRAKISHGPSGLYSATFELSTFNKLIKSTGNYTWVPAWRLVKTKTPEQIVEIQRLLTNG